MSEVTDHASLANHRSPIFDPQPWLNYDAACSLPAPAKLNLFLHITGRDDNGYHRLQTLLVFIDWQDALRFHIRSDGRIERHDERCHASHNINAQGFAALPGEDLCVRAARILQARAGCTSGATITLKKNIPQEAGLGGGSSDAATTLIALNRLWGLHLGADQLIDIGCEIGADVPFFLQTHNAWAEGYGERLTPLPYVPALQYAVLKPELGVSTKALFLHPNLPRAKKPATITGFAKDAGAALQQFWQIFAVVPAAAEIAMLDGANNATPDIAFENVMQNLAVQQCPDIGKALFALLSLGLSARMTGSGSAVFAPLPTSPHSADDWCKAIAPLLQQGTQMRICQGLSRHPLAAWING